MPWSKTYAASKNEDLVIQNAPKTMPAVTWGAHSAGLRRGLTGRTACPQNMYRLDAKWEVLSAGLRGGLTGRIVRSQNMYHIDRGNIEGNDVVDVEQEILACIPTSREKQNWPSYFAL